MLKAYCAAHDALDPAAVQRVWPTADVPAFRRQFNQNKSVQCKFDKVEINPLDTSAGSGKVKAELTIVYDRKVGGELTDERIADLTLFRPDASSGWYIRAATFKPKPKPK